MEPIVRTIYSSLLATAKLMNRPLTILPNSTLNQKFNLFPNDLPSSNELPILGYVGIGNKGATYEIASDSYVLTSPVPHLPRDASLYNFIPFVIRNINNDLSPTQRLKYRLRVPMSIGGTTYVAYYLRALDISNIIPSVELRNVNGETITTSAFTPTLSDLSPTPPAVSNTNLNTPSGDYLASTARVSFILNQTDISEVMDACALLYGDPRYAVINELALVTGVDKIVQGTFGGTVGNYTDVIAAQVAAFVYQYHALTVNTTKVEIEFDVGGSEALLV